jgi:hypothetical protein
VLELLTKVMLVVMVMRRVLLVLAVVEVLVRQVLTVVPMAAPVVKVFIQILLAPQRKEAVEEVAHLLLITVAALLVQVVRVVVAQQVQAFPVQTAQMELLLLGVVLAVQGVMQMAVQAALVLSSYEYPILRRQSSLVV